MIIGALPYVILAIIILRKIMGKRSEPGSAKVINYIILVITVLSNALFLFYFVGEAVSFLDRAKGAYVFFYLFSLFCQLLLPWAVLTKTIGKSLWWMFGIAMLMNLSVIWEKLVIVITSIHQDHLPSYLLNIFNLMSLTIGFVLGAIIYFLVDYGEEEESDEEVLDNIQN